ncbi:MAG TPA: hypothetical protein VM736_07195 [Gemmatimonadales bacterium]|nr:hypothetical protein [Gemmatimonadales bacterium]
MDPAIAVIAVVVTIAGCSIAVRFASALAKRLEARPTDVLPPDPAIGELRNELAAVQERLDFIERVLAQKEQKERALPGKSDQPESKVRTPV